MVLLLLLVDMPPICIKYKGKFLLKVLRQGRWRWVPSLRVSDDDDDDGDVRHGR
jgi:hypothetical protein